MKTIYVTYGLQQPQLTTFERKEILELINLENVMSYFTSIDLTYLEVAQTDPNNIHIFYSVTYYICHFKRLCEASFQGACLILDTTYNTQIVFPPHPMVLSLL